MVISNENIDQRKKFSMFHCRWILFYDMNRKYKDWLSKLKKLVKIYGKNEILDKFMKLCNEIFKSGNEVVNSCVEFFNIYDEHHV